MITVEHKKAHNFLVTLDEISVLLSYKNFGGRNAVDALGEGGLAELLEETERVIIAQNFSVGCQRIFQCAGVSNAMAFVPVTSASILRKEVPFPKRFR